MMQHTLWYAHTQAWAMRHVPVHVRAFSAFVLHCTVALLLALLTLLASPLLYAAEQLHRRQQKLPHAYKHVLVTGASSGVGECLCYAHARPGVRVVLVARRQEQLAVVAARCREQGAEAVVEVMDVANTEGMAAVVARAEQAGPLDLVFAAAGHEASMGPQEDIVGASRTAVQVNFLGMLNTILPCVAPMRARRCGQLVLFSSQLGFLAAPVSTDYDACKVGIRVYGEGLRSLLWKDNVAVNVIVPGGMVTPMMNSLAERAHLPGVPFMLPVPNALQFMLEGVQRNESVIAFPSLLTAFNSAFALLPFSTRTMLLTLLTPQHHRRWRLGDIGAYQQAAGASKPDDYYEKERQAEMQRQLQGRTSNN